MTARQARIAAGFRRVEDAAARLHISAAYLRQIERHGGASCDLGERIGRLYGCSPAVALWGSHGPKHITKPRVARPKRATQTESPRR